MRATGTLLKTVLAPAKRLIIEDAGVVLPTGSNVARRLGLIAHRWSDQSMEPFFRRAIHNVVEHGDTDIFPFPVENRILHDKLDSVLSLLKEIDASFDQYIIDFPPANHGVLAPVGYTGFRWATQIDPLWNVYFLALVVSIGEQIENVRLPIDQEIIFSYRFNKDMADSDLFDRRYGWKAFTERSLVLAERFKYIISCDISEFYPRLNHHRLDNALHQLPNCGSCRGKIMKFLSNFSDTYSFGIPVGGPASRLLSELTLNQVDRLLHQKKIVFCRFADDYHIFSDSESDAFKALVFLSEVLHRNQGLQLQKSKTRMMSAAEFVSTNPLQIESQEQDAAIQKGKVPRASIFSLSLHFDPYSANADANYDLLKKEVKRYPVLDLIKDELTKSRVNIALSRKLISVLQFIENPQLDDAARTLIENEVLLYPIYFNVLSAIKTAFGRLGEGAQKFVVDYVRDLLENSSPVMAVELNRQYAVRLLSSKRSEETVSLFSRMYDATDNPLIRRDLLLAMARWHEWFWLSDKKATFRSMRPSERRAFIMASYALSEEGRHWRDHTKREFWPFELIVREWIAERKSRAGWEIPL